MKKYKVNQVFSEIGKHCIFSKEHDYIIVTDWSNGDGFDIELETATKTEKISLTFGQFKLLKKMIKRLGDE